MDNPAGSDPVDVAEAPKPPKRSGAPKPGRRRAIVLVPGWARDRRGAMLGLLVNNLSKNDSMPVEAPSEGAITGETYRRLKPTATSPGPDRPEVDVYEAHWADLAREEEETGGFKRFARATGLILYWVLHHWWIRRSRQSLVLAWTILFSGAILLAWYVVILLAFSNYLVATFDTPPAVEQKTAQASFLHQRAADGGTPPTRTESGQMGGGGASGPSARADEVLSPTDVRDTLLGYVYQQIAPVLRWLSEHSASIIVILTAVLASVNATGFIAVARFAQDYLQSGANEGLDMDVTQRVQNTLNHVYAHEDPEKPGSPYYDEVVVLGHSFGAVIALEALAGWGNTSVTERTTLVTWGSVISSMAARCPDRVGKKVEEACAGAIPHWIDVYSKRDGLSGPVPEQRAAFPGACFEPRFPVSLAQVFFSSTPHMMYFYNHETLGMLLRSELPQCEVGAKTAAAA
ncbi:MAG: hypothetical protein AAGK00_06360 [Pseudomonadota bacterium]